MILACRCNSAPLSESLEGSNFRQVFTAGSQTVCACVKNVRKTPSDCDTKCATSKYAQPCGDISLT